MKNPLTLFSGAAAGATLMYFLDPERGARRRARLRDQAVSGLTTTGDAMEPASEDLANRTRGLLHELRSRFFGEDVSNLTLQERVRAAMGRWTSHPGAITVSAHDGRVTLRGPILEHEVEGLLRAVRRVRGVLSIDNQLTPHKTAGNIPALQGGDVPSGRRLERWSPAKRLLTGLSAGAVTSAGVRRGGVLGGLLSALGLGVLVRAITDKPFRRLVGVGSGHRAVDIQKNIDVNASPEELFRFWSNFENFPRFMSHIEEVTALGNDRSHWVVNGPAGTTIAWDAYVTRWIENREIAWATDENTPVQNAGVVRFTPNRQGGTQVSIHMSYSPPAGAAGHTVAQILGYDPKELMDEDLVRFKTLIEEGKTTANSRTVTREEIAS